MFLPASVCHTYSYGQIIFEKLEVLCKMAHSWKSEYHVFGEILLVLAEFSIFFFLVWAQRPPQRRKCRGVIFQEKKVQFFVKVLKIKT